MDILISGAKIGSPHCVTNWGGQGSRRERDTGDTTDQLLLWDKLLYVQYFFFKLHEYPVQCRISFHFKR